MSTSTADGNVNCASTLVEYPQDNIRNFSIVAHVDHGKSTLADRLLELTGTISIEARRGADGVSGGDGRNRQVLDKLKVERERGITVKAQAATMRYAGDDGTPYLLNLIDTPGHIDFAYEVSRSLRACQGVLLLVDASQGVQAQTVANFYAAFAQNLAIIPVINKIDLPSAEPSRVLDQLKSAFDLDPDNAVLISAKTGLGVKSVLQAVTRSIPAPNGSASSMLRAQVIDSWYDTYKGVVSLISVIDGQIAPGDQVILLGSKRSFEISQVGVMAPDQQPTACLHAGQVGYIMSTVKDPRDVIVGDTITANVKGNTSVVPLVGFVTPKPMVFAGVFPTDPDDYLQLDTAVRKLAVNDTSVTIQKESSVALGQGLRIGFLGSLHMEVFCQRLQEEYETEVIISQPTVLYKVIERHGRERYIRTPLEFPTGEEMSGRVLDLQEPMVAATLIFPSTYLGDMLQCCTSRRGEQPVVTYLDDVRVMMKSKMPLAEVVTDFHDEIKSLSSGYASFDYEEVGYSSSDLVKLDGLLNGKPVDAMCSIVHRSNADRLGRQLVRKLKDTIPRQLFQVAIQAAVGSRIIARETLSPYRKDVTAKLYGGDVTRKMKLLNKQKEGKKRMKRIGNVEVPKEAFSSLLSMNNSR